MPADNVSFWKRNLEQVFDTGQQVVFEFDFDSPDFGLRRFSSIAAPEIKDGRVVSIVTVSRDITDLKNVELRLRESEERFRTLADNISQLAWMANGSGDIFWYNKRWYEYTGTGSEVMRREGWRDVVHPAHADRILASSRLCLDEGKIWEDTFPLRGRTGEYRWFLTRAVPIRDESGKVIRWFGTNTDITELRGAQKALEEADRRKNDFLAMLAHELRNPMSTISAAVTLLQRMALPQQAEKAKKALERQTRQMSKLVDDLLDISRITRGKLKLDKEPLDVRLAIERAAEMIRPQIEARRHGLSVAIPDNTVMVLADPLRLQQIFTNLLSNAAKYTDEGGKISICLRKQAGQAIIQVRDNGSGIPKELQQRIFDPFQQAEATMSKARGGMGIGLAIVKRLTEMHGGAVEVESEGLGKGSLFTVRLPLAEETLQERVASDRQS